MIEWRVAASAPPGALRVDAPVARILDANFNRAREATRLVEDFARFALDDAASAGELKRLRHELRDLAGVLGGERLLAARAIESDVGREAKLPAELQRPDLVAVVRAEFARLAEAVRVIAECAKLADADAALRAERVRYRAYEIEQRLLLRGDVRRRLAAVRLYVIVTESLCAAPWRETVEAVLSAGVGCVQLREKTLPDVELLRRARELRALTQRHGALLIINDRADIAAAADADGVHLGQDDLPLAEARRVAGARLLVGRSTRSAEQAALADAQGHDYIAIGPMYASQTKPAAQVAGVEALRQARAATQRPLVAIGGITPDRATELRRAGADCLCVCQAVIASRDARAAAAAFVGV